MSVKSQLGMLKLMQTSQKIGKNQYGKSKNLHVDHPPPKLSKIKNHYGKTSKFTQKLRHIYIFEIWLDNRPGIVHF
jgi:hypothetical protein